ncbi:PREDICTED: adapter molecule Crk isoform X2 [Papilio polytes]|uniref:adapter molecule Crk isoform X2 n=1 Tax=Papilio polytes TaxID=76194 RepID=UPI000675FD16|nr:PREDICTED: adapter molecule Crk isoform X2 [Papilio polytes]
MANPAIGISFDPNDMSSWYFGGLSRAEATKLLLNETESGVFLVRDSKTIHGDYVLCVREDDRVSHYIINHVVSADGSTRFRIGDQLFADMPALLAFYRLHYLDTTPLVRPLPQARARAAAPPPPQPHTVLELVIAKFDFVGSDADDLPFRRGERLMVINRDEEQWWTARNAHGRTGSIPVPYVQRILDASGAPYPPAEALSQLGDPPSPPGARHPQQRTNMQRSLPALARVRQTRVPNAYDKTALKLEEGDIVKVTKMNINGQWEGELNGKIGHFPFTYVEFLDDTAS